MAPKKTIKRNKLSDSQLKSEIIALFNSAITGKMDVFGNIRNKFTIARDRYTNMYNICYSEWGALKANADKEVTEAAAIYAAKIGLKSKLDKQLHIQKQIDEIQADIDSGILVDYAYVNFKFEKIEKVMNAETKAYLRLAIKTLYAELNKMEGDYAVTRTDVTTNGESITPTIVLNQFLGAAIDIKESE